MVILNNVTLNKCVSTAPDKTAYAIPGEPELRSHFDKIREKAESYRSSGRKIVAVQGLGYVGAAVAAAIASAKDRSGQAKFFVIGVDLPSPSGYWKVAKMNDGLAPVISPDPEFSGSIKEAVCRSGNLCASVSEDAFAVADVIIVDIPLHVSSKISIGIDQIAIDFENFENGIRTIGRKMRDDALVLVETTVPIGASSKVIFPILEAERHGRGIDKPVLLAHAYERVMPGPNYIDSIRNYWRTFSAIDEASAAKAREFLSSFIDTGRYPLRRLYDTDSSEMAKLLENSYRATNIAFIHEWTLLAEDMGIDLFDVIDSIRVRKGTHDNMRLPGFGVGGYCLTKDQLFAQWSAVNLFNSEVILMMTLNAMNVNEKMPLHALHLLEEIAASGLRGKRIAVCGITYLPEVADTRYSPAGLLVDKLIETGAEAVVHDPFMMAWDERPEMPVSQDLEKCLNSADGIVFAVRNLEYLNLPTEILLKNRRGSMPFIVDAQNIISDEKADELHRAGCVLAGVGKGHWRKRGYNVRRM